MDVDMGGYGNDLCANCKQRRADHKLLNYSDDPLRGMPVLVCPTATFKDEE